MKMNINQQGILHEDGREESVYQWLHGRLNLTKKESNEIISSSETAEVMIENDHEFLGDYYL